MFYSPRHLKSLILCRAHVFGGEVGLLPVPPPLTWQPTPEMNEQAMVTGTLCSRWALRVYTIHAVSSEESLGTGHSRLSNYRNPETRTHLHLRHFFLDDHSAK